MEENSVFDGKKRPDSYSENFPAGKKLNIYNYYNTSYLNTLEDKFCSGKTSISKTLSGIFNLRLKILKEPIDEINDEIRLRQVLNNSLIQEITVKLKHINFLLRDLDNWTMGYNESIENRRLELQREILALEKEIRSEKVRFWEDMVSLVNKRIDYLIEYRTIKSISELL